MGKTFPETRPLVVQKAFLPFLIHSKFIIDHFDRLWQPSGLPGRIPSLQSSVTPDPRRWDLFNP